MEPTDALIFQICFG